MPNITSPTLQWLGFLFGFLVISWATLTPVEQLPPAPIGSDKLHHIIGFGGWAAMCAFGPMKRFLPMAAFIIIWGGAIELIQPSINRYGEWWDFHADTLGVLIVLIARLVIAKRMKA